MNKLQKILFNKFLREMRDITTSLNKAVDEYKQVMKDQDMRKKLKSKIQKS